MKKDNLLFKLDLLEGQLKSSELEEDEEVQTRLRRTKFALKKTKDTPEDILAQITSLKAQLVDRKVHHANVQIARTLKTAYPLETIKIRKRIKKLINDNDQKAKVKVLEDELQLLAEKSQDGIFNPKSLASLIVNKHLKKSYWRKGKTPVFFAQDLIKQALSSDISLSPVKNNVFGRFCALAGVKTALKELNDSIGIIDTGERKSVAAEIETTKSSETTAKQKSKEYEDNVEQEEEDEDEDDEDDKEESDGEEDVSKYDNMMAGSDDESEEEPEIDPFFDSNLPTLASGYISGSDDEDNYDYDNDKQVKQITSERNNRRGQRARRRIWELKYGSGANHVVKEKTDMAEKRAQKQREFEEREARRQERRARNPRPDPTSNTFESTGTKRKAPTEDGSLHPSWEAKKKQQASAKFEGKKIKFD